MIVNNTGADVWMFHDIFISCAKGEPLPEDLVDMFAVRILVENGITKVIVTFA